MREIKEKTNEELLEILDSLYMAIPLTEKKLVAEIVEIEREINKREGA